MYHHSLKLMNIAYSPLPLGVNSNFCQKGLNSRASWCSNSILLFNIEKVKSLISLIYAIETSNFKLNNYPQNNYKPPPHLIPILCKFPVLEKRCGS